MDTKDQERDESRWFSTRCVFRWSHPETYEERITIWRARDIDEAIDLGEAEAILYADRFGLNFLEIVQAYEIAVGALDAGAEVFSLLRDNQMDAEDYVTAFFDTGSERQRKSD